MRLSHWLVAGSIVIPTPALAAPPEGRTEVSLLFGVSLLDVQEETEGFPFFRDRPVPARPEVTPLPFDFKQRRSIGGSFVQGFRVGRYVSDRAALEVGFAVAPSHDLGFESFFECSPGVVCPLGGGRRAIPDFSDRRSVAAYHYDLSFAFDLAGGDTRPFLSFGLGAVSYDAPERVETDFAMTVAGGVKMWFGKVGARLEFGDRIVPDHFLTGDAEHDVHVRGGFVFRLP